MPERYFIVYKLSDCYLVAVNYTHTNLDAPAKTIRSFLRQFSYTINKRELLSFVQMLLDFGFEDLTDKEAQAWKIGL